MKIDLYEQITVQIITQLEAGIAPWVKPWTNGVAPIGGALPHNVSTGRAYSGVNILLLWAAQAERGFSGHAWATFKQAQALGGSVRKGEKGTRIIYADSFVPAAERARAAAEGRDPDSVWMLKAFTVFNADQLDGIAAPEPAEPAAPTIAPHAAAELLIQRSGADYRIGGDKAFYSPAGDYVGMPAPEAFGDPLDYYRTATHELTHWTGAEHRLARQYGKRFGDSAYAREELVAEMGAAFACAAIGIQPALRHADYLGHWLKVLREDKRAIVSAASAASKASEFLLANI